MDAREVAMMTLHNCQRQGGWSDGVLKKQIAAAGLDARIPGWREMAFAGFFGALIDAALATPTLPTT